MSTSLTERSDVSDRCEFTLDILQMDLAYYFYILECCNGDKYYGHTNNLIKRVAEHTKGHIDSTKHRRPLKLVYYEKFDSRSEAFMREMHFKNGRTRRETIEKMIKSFDICKMSRV